MYISNLREAAQQALDAIAEAHDESLDENHFECRQILMAQVTSLRTALAQPDDKAQPVLLEHVAVAEDGGKLRWLTARRPMDCELYAMPYGMNTPPRLYAATQPPAEQPEPEWIDDPHDIEQGMMRNPKWKPAEQGAELSDAQAELLIDSSDGRWVDGEFRIDGRDLMKLLRAARGGER